MSNFGLSCDVCNRENIGVTWVNGMKFCAKCYQEIFGANTKEITYVYGGNLKEHIKVIEEKDQRIRELEEENQVLKDRWEKLKEFLYEECEIEEDCIYDENGEVIDIEETYLMPWYKVWEKIRELEKGERDVK